MDQSSPYLGYWPSRGSASLPGASSPTVANPVNATPGANALRRDHEPDDASFAISYRAETSPLFDPFSQPRTNPGPSIVSLGMPNDATATPTWNWHPESSVLDNNNEVSQLSPILGHDVPTRKEEASVSQNDTIWDDDVVPESTPGDELRLSQAAPNTFDTASQQVAAEEPKAEIIETSVDIEMEAQVPQPVPNENVLISADTVESSAAEEEQQRTEPEAPTDQEAESIQEPEIFDTASPKDLELEQAEVDTQLDESIAGEQTFPSPPRDEPVLAHSVSQEDVPESAQRRSSGLESDDETDHMDVDIPARVDKIPPSSPDGLATTEEPSAAELSAKKRPRRSANDLLCAASEAFVDRDYEGHRKRRASAPPTKPAQPKTNQTKASRASARASTTCATRAPALKNARKSMPVKLATETPATETPKKRGRPRKSEGAATPATVTKSAVKRGRHAKAGATPAKKSSAVVPASARSRRVLKVTKITTVTKTTTPRKVATPRTDGRLRRVAESEATASTPEGTPKRRGRPPKSAQSTPGRPAPTPQSARLAKMAQTEPPKKRGRPVAPRAVPSPIKRGRPARKAASPVPEPASAKAEPKKRGRPSLVAQAEKVASSSPAGTLKKRGRPSAIAQAEKVASASPADTPKRRGRPPKNPAPEPVPEVRSLKEPVTRKRGRGALTEDGSIPAELPAPTRKRGRAAKPAVEAEPAPPAKRRGRVAAAVPPVPAELPAATRKRGRAANVTVEETKVEPAAKKQRTTRQTEAAPEPPKRGRGRKAAVVEPPAVEEVAKPKGRGKGRKAVKAPTAEEVAKPKTRGRRAAAAEEPTVEAESVEPKRRGRAAKTAEPIIKEPAEPKRRGRAAKAAPVAEEPAEPNGRGRAAKSGKGELPSKKTTTEEAPKRKGRTAAAAAPKGVVKKKAAPAARSLRSRG